MANNVAGDLRVIASDGNSYIAPSQRADGSWRKPRKVKTGFVPQEEVPAYMSKGKQFTSPGKLVGLSGQLASAKVQEPSSSSSAARKSEREVAAASRLVERMAVNPKTAHQPIPVLSEAQKKVRTLQKKLQDIEKLQSRIDSGELVDPERTQLEKLSRKDEILKELHELENADQ